MYKQIKELIKAETIRQNNGIELIASENYTSKQIRDACGSILTNKYAEGYPGKRYYGGCQYIDAIEEAAIESAKKIFNCKYANVQPHSGSQANAAAYRALLPTGGKILALCLSEGGHLTHGSPVSFSSATYNFCFYHLDASGKLDYNSILKVARKEHPNLLLAGYSAYPYEIDFKKLREIADKVNCKLMVDMAHIAGLVACGEHMSPIPYADVVTSTTHKTLRGPRGGLILTNDKTLSKLINAAVFPFYQGGPLEHIIAGKALCFQEAATTDFKDYIKKVKENTKVCCQALSDHSCSVSGTDNHLFLLNTVDSFDLNGRDAQKLLEEIGITTNKNMLPNDPLPPHLTSGLRIGFAAVTTRGCSVAQAKEIADIIYTYLSANEAERATLKDKLAKQVHQITRTWKRIENI